MWFLVIPLVLAVGLVVAVLAVVLGVLVRVAIELIPLLLVGLGLWLLFGSRHGLRARRRRSERHQRAECTGDGRHLRPVPTAQPASQTVRPARAPVVRPQQPPQPDLPIDVQVKAEQIKRKAEVLQGYAHRFPPLSQDLYIVRQTASEYLPRTIKTYLALPSGAGERMVTASGKTALEELREQLQIMDAKLDDIAEDLQRRDLAGLMANRHFLEERFGVRGPEDESRETGAEGAEEASSLPTAGSGARADAA